MLQDRITALLVKSAKLPADACAISPSVPIAQQSCMDSKRFLAFVMALEVEFGIDVSRDDEIFRHLETVDSIASYLRSKGLA